MTIGESENMYFYMKKKKKKVHKFSYINVCKYDKSTCKFVINMVNWKGLPTVTTEKPRRLIIIQSVIC